MYLKCIFFLVNIFTPQLQKIVTLKRTLPCLGALLLDLTGGQSHQTPNIRSRCHPPPSSQCVTRTLGTSTGKRSVTMNKTGCDVEEVKQVVDVANVFRVYGLRQCGAQDFDLQGAREPVLRCTCGINRRCVYMAGSFAIRFEKMCI